MALDRMRCKITANLGEAWKLHILLDFSVSTEISTGEVASSRQPPARSWTRTYPKRGRFLALLTRKLPLESGMANFKLPADHGEPAQAGKTEPRAQRRRRLPRSSQPGTRGQQAKKRGTAQRPTRPE